ncbi:MAG: beta-class carbonic anhydrase [Candidatus Limnocylindria bacterium]
MNAQPSPSGIELLVERNDAYAESHGGELPHEPTLRIAVVACMDCRIDVYRMLGLQPAEAHVIRNAGGRARDALRSLIVSQHKLGTRKIMCITHSSCGMASFRAEDFQSELGPAADAIAFDTLDSPEAAAAEDVRFLSEHPLILPETVIRGFVYDLDSGALRMVSEL